MRFEISTEWPNCDMNTWFQRPSTWTVLGELRKYGYGLDGRNKSVFPKYIDASDTLTRANQVCCSVVTVRTLLEVIGLSQSV
jgi:hypothetical protein